MTVVTGSEDGKIYGWDLNSQEIILKKELDRSIIDEKHSLISSIDYDANLDLIAASGNFKGLYLEKFSDLVSS